MVDLGYRPPAILILEMELCQLPFSWLKVEVGLWSQLESIRKGQ